MELTPLPKKQKLKKMVNVDLYWRTIFIGEQTVPKAFSMLTSSRLKNRVIHTLS